MEVIANILQKGDLQIIEIPKEFRLKANKARIVSKGNYFIIEPIKDKPRKGWDEAFKEMRKNSDDTLLINDVFEEDIDV